MARKYARDNRGRFAGRGAGATARGGRLKTAAGNKRKTQTMQSSAATKGTIGKPKGLKPQSARKLRTGIAVNRMRSINQKIDKSPDTAVVNIPMSGSRGRRLDAEINRNVKAQKAATRSADKTRNRQFKSDTSRAKKLRDAQAGNIAKAKGISKGQVTSALKAQPPSVQIKALKNFIRENRANVRPARAAAKPPATKGARLGGTRRTTRATAPRNTTANRTGQSKTLNRFNSRPVGTMVAGKGTNLVPSTKRVPLNITQKTNDQAFARVATKAARSRAAAPAKAQQKQTTAQRAARAASNQKRVTQAVLTKSSRRPTRKQRRSIMTAESAKRFYATKAVDYLKVNVKKPGFRLPRGMR